MSMKAKQEMPEPLILETMTRTVEIPMNEGNIFTFPDGVPAFEDHHKFVFFCNTDMQPFFFMKSIGISPEVSFVCIDPFLICPNYNLRLSQADLKALELKRSEDAFVFSFVTVRDDVTQITANLQGPVVLNQRKGIGRQIICEGGSYDVRFKVWDALMKIDDPTFKKKQSVDCGVRA